MLFFCLRFFAEQLNLMDLNYKRNKSLKTANSKLVSFLCFQLLSPTMHNTFWDCNVKEINIKCVSMVKLRQRKGSMIFFVEVSLWPSPLRPVSAFVILNERVRLYLFTIHIMWAAITNQPFNKSGDRSKSFLTVLFPFIIGNVNTRVICTPLTAQLAIIKILVFTLSRR